MFEQTMLQAVAVERMSDARHAADLHRQRVLLRRDARSVLATWLQGLAMRLDTRACSPGDAPSLGSQGSATDRELCRAA
jgi:hypothetical protein